MFHKRRLSWIPAFMFLMLAFASQDALAAWTWTPEIGGWLNLRRQPRETASLQFQYAEELLGRGDTDNAINEYRKVLRYYPASNYCDLAQYSIGRAYEAQGDYEEAVDAYQKVIDDYPNTQLFGHVLAKQRKIADLYFERGVEREERFTLFRGSNFDKAIDTYRNIIENQPFSETAAEAQYRIGLCYMKLEMYDEASAEFQKLIDYYPSSKWVAEAAFGAAESMFCQALPCEYDTSAIEDAVKKFQYFLRVYPDSARAAEAREKLGELQEVAAEHEYRIAMEYHHNMRYESARLYFDSIVNEFPETQWAEKAREKLSIMP